MILSGMSGGQIGQERRGMTCSRKFRSMPFRCGWGQGCNGADGIRDTRQSRARRCFRCSHGEDYDANERFKDGVKRFEDGAGRRGYGFHGPADDAVYGADGGFNNR
jgi:hypothetical protein